jgi:hypothetical protein
MASKSGGKNIIFQYINIFFLIISNNIYYSFLLGEGETPKTMREIVQSKVLIDVIGTAGNII